jgi:hypothetical protein
VTNLVLVLDPAGGNLVRNADFSMHWVHPVTPDCWSRVNAAWEGEVLALQSGQRYRAHAEFAPGARGEVLVRWSSEQPFALPKPLKAPRIETKNLTPETPTFYFIGSSNMALMQLSVRGSGHPTNTVRRVSVRPWME